MKRLFAAACGILLCASVTAARSETAQNRTSVDTGAQVIELNWNTGQIKGVQANPNAGEHGSVKVEIDDGTAKKLEDFYTAYRKMTPEARAEFDKVYGGLKASGHEANDTLTEVRDFLKRNKIIH